MNYWCAYTYESWFKAILTYDSALLKQLPDKARLAPFGGSWISFDKWGMYEKTKDFCMILSDKTTTEGHRLRHEIAKEFGDKIDLYGAGVGQQFGCYDTYLLGMPRDWRFL